MVAAGGGDAGEGRVSANWRTLAELYNLMGAPETALVLFDRALPQIAPAEASVGGFEAELLSPASEATSQLLQGLAARLRGDLAEAEAHFADALADASGMGPGPSSAEVDLMQRERVGAMAALSRWGHLPEPGGAGRHVAMADAGNDNGGGVDSDEEQEGVLDFVYSRVQRPGASFAVELATKPAAREAFLSAFIRAASRVPEAHARDMLEAVIREASGKDPAAKEEVEGRFGLDAAVSAAYHGHADRARILLASYGRQVRGRIAIRIAHLIYRLGASARRSVRHHTHRKIDRSTFTCLL